MLASYSLAVVYCIIPDWWETSASASHDLLLLTYRYKMWLWDCQVERSSETEKNFQISFNLKHSNSG